MSIFRRRGGERSHDAKVMNSTPRTTGGEAWCHGRQFISVRILCAAEEAEVRNGGDERAEVKKMSQVGSTGGQCEVNVKSARRSTAGRIFGKWQGRGE